MTQISGIIYGIDDTTLSVRLNGISLTKKDKTVTLIPISGEFLQGDLGANRALTIGLLNSIRPYVI